MHTHTRTPGKGVEKTSFKLDVISDDDTKDEASTSIALEELTTLPLSTRNGDGKLLDGVITAKDSISTPTDLEVNSTAVVGEEEETILLSVCEPGLGIGRSGKVADGTCSLREVEGNTSSKVGVSFISLVRVGWDRSALKLLTEELTTEWEAGRMKSKSTHPLMHTYTCTYNPHINTCIHTCTHVHTHTCSRTHTWQRSWRNIFCAGCHL